MIKINLNKNIKEQFDKNGLGYPFLKYNKKYGLKKSSMFENKDLSLCLLAYLKYLYEKSIIDFDNKRYFEILDNKEGIK